MPGWPWPGSLTRLCSIRLIRDGYGQGALASLRKPETSKTPQTSNTSKAQQNPNTKQLQKNKDPNTPKALKRWLPGQPWPRSRGRLSGSLGSLCFCFGCLVCFLAFEVFKVFGLTEVGQARFGQGASPRHGQRLDTAKNIESSTT